MAAAVEVIAQLGITDPPALPVMRTMGGMGAGSAALAGGCLWIFGGKRLALPDRADHRLAEAARRLGLSTEETMMRAIDASLPRLEVDGNTGSRSRQGR